MIVNKNMMEEVKKFGLNSYEAKIWTALLSRGISTAGELSEIANVPRSRSYDVLESLEKKGFIIMKVGKPIQYLAIKPDQVLERVKKKISEDTEFQLKQLEKLNDSKLLNDLTSLHDQGIETLDPMEVTSIIRGRNNLHSQLGYLIKNAKKSVKIISSDEGIKRKTKALKKQLKHAKESGVKITLSSPNKNLNAEDIETIKQYGEYKATNNDSRMAIIDDENTLLMLANDNEINSQYDTAVWVRSGFLANSLKKLF